MKIHTTHTPQTTQLNFKEFYSHHNPSLDSFFKSRTDAPYFKSKVAIRDIAPQLTDKVLFKKCKIGIPENKELNDFYETTEYKGSFTLPKFDMKNSGLEDFFGERFIAEGSCETIQDPQYFEHKLKGKTMENMVMKKMTDPTDDEVRRNNFRSQLSAFRMTNLRPTDTRIEPPDLVGEPILAPIVAEPILAPITGGGAVIRNTANVALANALAQTPPSSPAPTPTSSPKTSVKSAGSSKTTPISVAKATHTKLRKQDSDDDDDSGSENIILKAHTKKAASDSNSESESDSGSETQGKRTRSKIIIDFSRVQDINLNAIYDVILPYKDTKKTKHPTQNQAVGDIKSIDGKGGDLDGFLGSYNLRVNKSLTINKLIILIAAEQKKRDEEPPTASAIATPAPPKKVRATASKPSILSFKAETPEKEAAAKQILENLATKMKATRTKRKKA